MLKQYRWLKSLVLTLKVLLKTSLIRARAGRSLFTYGSGICIMTVLGRVLCHLTIIIMALRKINNLMNRIVNNQLELKVLAVRDGAANCRVLGTGEKTLLRMSSYQLFKIVPGEIATVYVKKQWKFGGNKYVSGNLIDHRIDIPALDLVPLKLEQFDYWDPREAFEEERDENDEIVEEEDEYYKAIIKAGRRPSYEMEQIVPGDTDLNADGPILDAIYYKDMGEIGMGEDILMDEIIADLRCLDAHAHLGNFSFDNWPKKALLHHEVGMRIGELSLPKNFNGVLL